MNLQVHESTPAHTQPIDEIIASTGSNIERGLTEVQAAGLRERFGSNELPEAPPEHLWQRIIRQFTDLVVWVLIAAAVLAGLVGEWTDAAVILAIVILNAALGAVQEERAGRALAALRRLSVPQARLLRNGSVRRVAARELVPGDRIILDTGERVPADARLLYANGLTVQESALTGESATVEKDTGALPARDAPLVPAQWSK
jgi:Ca2+-transporting ATPase